MIDLPFNRPYRTGGEGARIAAVLERGWTGGNGPQSAYCETLLQELTQAHRVLLTHSCTGALEMAALLSGVGPGDEVIMPSFTFVSTANAFVLRGATPVFVDIDPVTLNIDPGRAAAALTPSTRAIAAVHYGGVGCDMAALTSLAREHGLLLVEDAAQGIGATMDGRALGAIGDLGALSFHETKNLSCGEGGALLLNDERWAERAEILQEKGTNRSRFSRGEVDHYSWVDLGSSFLMSDVTAALLADQLERLAEITAARLEIWNAYHAALEPLERADLMRRPTIPPAARHNAHLYRLMVRDRPARDGLIAALAADGIGAYFHYVPLHSAPAGERYGRVHGPMDVTDAAAGRLVRLPLWVGMTGDDVARVVDAVGRAVD
ncbi:MAG: dTDP-4-amino-4,6-dideoxygalactose transaminase [Solirubrobacteraceae bacterium]|jgi:dTDP-4-amino-4,6-dideoxygalactose transaminase|nr:dTDP-4-amino-4,6-dideoxygalactose transaminase [Solirubrobacteraceae bacterium]